VAITAGYEWETAGQRSGVSLCSGCRGHSDEVDRVMGVRIALVVAAISRHHLQQQIVFATHAFHRNFHHELAVGGKKHPTSGGAAQRHTGSECLSVCVLMAFSAPHQLTFAKFSTAATTADESDGLVLCSKIESIVFSRGSSACVLCAARRGVVGR
jgi:hypothetical protein